jgi:hypothetical protein
MNITQTRPHSLVLPASTLSRVALLHDVSRIPEDSATYRQRNPHCFNGLSLVLRLQPRRYRRWGNGSGKKERNAMRNLDMTWQVIGRVALSCALNGIGVAVVTLVILAWNNCVFAAGQDNLVPAQASERVC